jgi:hypothetical protein
MKHKQVRPHQRTLVMDEPSKCTLCVDIKELVEMGRSQQVSRPPSTDATHR